MKYSQPKPQICFWKRTDTRFWKPCSRNCRKSWVRSSPAFPILCSTTFHETTSCWIKFVSRSQEDYWIKIFFILFLTFSKVFLYIVWLTGLLVIGGKFCIEDLTLPSKLYLTFSQLDFKTFHSLNLTFFTKPTWLSFFESITYVNGKYETFHLII